MIFTTIHQWGNSPLDKVGLVMFALINIVIILCVRRIKVIIDDESVVYRSDIWIPVRIPIIQIQTVSLGRANFKETATAKIDSYDLEYTRNVVCIQLKNSKSVHLFVKNAVQVKEEIEKRMLKQNNI